MINVNHFKHQNECCQIATLPNFVVLVHFGNLHNFFTLTSTLQQKLQWKIGSIVNDLNAYVYYIYALEMEILTVMFSLQTLIQNFEHLTPIFSGRSHRWASGGSQIDNVSLGFQSGQSTESLTFDLGTSEVTGQSSGTESMG